MIAIYKKYPLILKVGFYAQSLGALACNGLQLGEVAEIEAQMFSFAQKFNRRTTVDLALKPPFCQTAVVRSPFFSVVFIVI
ncbi:MULTISPECIES: hypothetical protein [unclassified Empedobacter]|uniref:hypothetical protein n=1 Tax=unclassified Empedobacter TaxID=2643773 RepID=UPI0025BA5CC0|nr:MULTISPECIES: hypothetical protein [unclassified Empedobacter]